MKKYFIDGENETFTTLAEVRHHCWLMNSKDRDVIAGSVVMRMTSEDESEVVGFVSFKNGKCVISRK